MDFVISDPHGASLGNIPKNSIGWGFECGLPFDISFLSSNIASTHVNLLVVDAPIALHYVGTLQALTW